MAPSQVGKEIVQDQPATPLNPGNATPPGATTTAPLDATPVLKIEPEVLDLGEMMVDTAKTGKVKLINISDKPVIITKYGGLKEYVQTPYVVDCTVGEIGFDDFLYTKNLKWGQPSLDSLMHHMKECYDKRLVTWDHTFSRNLVSAVPAHISKLAKLPGQQKATR